MVAVHRLIRALVITAAVLVGVVVVALITSQTPWFKDWLRRYVSRQANQYLNAELSIDRLGGNLFTGLELQNVRIVREGRPVIAIKDVGLDYNIINFIARGAVVDAIRITQPRITLRRTRDGWDIARLIKHEEQEADRGGPGRPISIGEIGISDGEVSIEDETPEATPAVRLPKRLERIDAKAAFSYAPVRFTVDLAHFSLRADNPGVALNSLSGQISVHDDAINFEKVAVRTAESSMSLDGAIEHYTGTPSLNATISSDKLTPRELAAIVPALAGIHVQPAFEVKLAGPMSDLQVQADVRTAAGQAQADVRGNLQADVKSLKGELHLTDFNAGRILDRKDLESDVTGQAAFDLRGRDVDDVRGTIALKTGAFSAAGYRVHALDARAVLAGRRIDLKGEVDAYGAHATADGTLTRAAAANGPMAYDVRGRLQAVNVRSLPLGAIPQLSTRLSGAYHVRGAGARTTADLRLDRSTVEGASFSAGTEVHVSMNGNRLAYSARGSVTDLDPQRLGRALRQPALAADRYKGRVNADFDVEGAGRELSELVAGGTVTLHDSTVLGGHVPQFELTGRLDHQVLDASVRGAVEGIDPGALSGREALAGSINGAIDARLAVPDITTPTQLAGAHGTGLVTVGASRVGGVEIRSAVLKGSVDGEVATLERLNADTSAGTVEASGPVALTDTGRSNLTYQAVLPDLHTLAGLGGVQDVAGTARLVGSIEGNRQQLRLKGTLSGSNLRYGDTASAVSLSSQFEADVPNLTPADAKGTADTTATLVKLAGRDLREVKARTSYAQRSLTFDGTLAEVNRSLSARGLVVLEPSARELRLEQLGLRTGDLQWSTPPGPPSTIRYEGNRVSVDRFVLQNGAQRIEVAGTVDMGERESATPAEASIGLVANNVQLDQIDRLLMGERGVRGELNANLRLTGSTAAPTANGEVTVVKGGFRNFAFDSLTAKLDTDPQAARVDMRLQQSPQAWLTAAGSVPMSDLRGTPAVAGAPPLDVRVVSSPIDLGLVQGITTAVTDVKGTLKVDAHVSGSFRAPRLDGELSVAQGAFSVPAVETNFTQLDARIRMAGDQVHIDQFAIHDNHGDPLTLSGGITLRENQVAAVDIKAKADSFRVMDGKLASLQVAADLSAKGAPLTPRVEGTIDVHEGRLEIDRILELVQTGLYSTEALEAPSARPAETPAAAAAQAAASPADAMSFDVRLRVPDNLVVRGDDVRVGAQGFSLGNVNVTLGGELHATRSAEQPTRVVGEVRTIRGFYEFKGRRFDVLRDGTISFTGPDITDPRLNITAQRDISGVQAQIAVHGSAQRPTIDLSSTPPLDDADVLSLIVFNRPINDLGQGERASLAQTAGSLVGGMVAAPLAESLRDALDVDLLEIEAMSQNSGGPSVTIGNQIGERVFLQFRQLFGSGQATEVLLDYELYSFLRLRTTFTEGATDTASPATRTERGGVDLIYTIEK